MSEVSNLIIFFESLVYFLINEFDSNNFPTPRPEWNSFYRILGAGFNVGKFYKKVGMEGGKRRQNKNLNPL